MKTLFTSNCGLLNVRFKPRRLLVFLCSVALLAIPNSGFAAGRIANVSTRANVGRGYGNVILGTILVGSGSATLIFRGIGPSLVPYFPAGTTILADPNIQILDANGNTLGVNNNWQDDPDQAAAIQAAGFAPTNANESAFRIVLGPGTYSAVLTGVGGGIGIGLVEVYDITAQPSSIKLGNVSTRANAGTGYNAEIFGVTVQAGSRSMALVGRGPSMAPYFPAGLTLPNPALKLMSGLSQLQFNQNYKDNPGYHEISSTGFAPSNDLESGMVTPNLSGGAYTVVMDTSGGSGIATIEAYDLGEKVVSNDVGNGALVCTPNQYADYTIVNQSDPFTVAVGTPLTLRFGGHASHAFCPPCNSDPPGGPSCGGSNWSLYAVLVDNAFHDVGMFTALPNSGIGGSSGCIVLPLTVTRTAAGSAPYRVQFRATSSSSCFSNTSSVNVDYHFLNSP